MATIAVFNISTPRVLAKISDSPRAQPIKFVCLNNPLKRSTQAIYGRIYMQPLRAAPESVPERVVESSKNAEEACEGDPTSGECVTAWDEVEELSAAASHARDKKKNSDPLENYCKDNPETDECRTYED